MTKKLNLKPLKAAKAISPKSIPGVLKRQFEDLETDLQKASFFGFGAQPRPSIDVPDFISTKNETVYKRGNSFIVLGVDRRSHIRSGFGGVNTTHCAAIDIVAGRLGRLAVSHFPDNTPVQVNPNFKLDAARIYVSQKSNVDRYFGLKPGTVGSTSRKSPRSTVAIKADTLRFIARENIKLVTRTDRQNSQGGALGKAITSGYGIDLMAMNDDRPGMMQPLVKGDNLKSCVHDVLAAIHDLRDIFLTFLDYNRQFQIQMVFHTHYSPFYGSPTSPDFDKMPDGFKNIINMATNVESQCYLQMQKLTGIQQKYLEAPAGAETVKDNKSSYILSKYNNAN